MSAKTKVITWLKPFVFLTTISLFIFILNKSIDSIFYEQIQKFFSNFIFLNEFQYLIGSFSNMGEVVTALLGIEITAIAIIVQLAANKYSSKIMELFISDRVNFIVFSVYVVTGVNVVLISMVSGSNNVPYFSFAFATILLLLSIIIVIPHFTYVFNFLRPENFLKIIEIDSKSIFVKVAKAKEHELPHFKQQLGYNIDFIGDVALNSVHNSDRAIALLCLITFKNITNNYILHKSKYNENWFKLTGKENMDPDFADYSTFVMEKIEEYKVLVERKIFKLYELVFNITKLTQRDIASGVLMNSRQIFEQAILTKDYGVMWTVVQYFNSYLRISITAKDPRSAFNTLEHYRILGEGIIGKNEELLLKIFNYFKFYGQESSKNNVLFILETAAYDLYILIQMAYKNKSENVERLLGLFLHLDDSVDSDQNKSDMSLIGVRIAQVKMAAFFIKNDEIKFAKMIYKDMLVEPKERIERIRQLISSTTNEEFWEITPRGLNFYFLSDEDKNYLVDFFNWFK